MEVTDIDDTGDIDNNTYTIHFCDPERMPYNVEKENNMGDDGAFFCQPLPPKTISKLVKQIHDTNKKIIKIEITGHAANDGRSQIDSPMMRCGPLSHEVLAFLLSQFPFDNKILLIKNKTCYSNSNLPKHDDLPDEYKQANYVPSDNETNDFYSLLMTNYDITQILSLAFTSVNKMCYYYGGVDQNQTGEADIALIQRKAKSLTNDKEEKFWNVNDKQTTDVRKQQRDSYCNQLRQDLQSLQQQNNNHYNDQYNFPPPPKCSQMPYGGGNIQLNNGFPTNFMPYANNLSSQQQYYQQMPYSNNNNNNNNNIPFNQVNNYTNPVSLQSPQYQQNPYINNNINNNTTNTNNHNVDVPTYQTMQQQGQNDSNTNINGGTTNSDGGNQTEKNNGNVFCDLKSGICCGCKWW